MNVTLTEQEVNLILQLVGHVNVKASDPQGGVIWAICQELIMKLEPKAEEVKADGATK